MSLRNTRIGLFLLGFLLYANTITHSYTQDDAIVITNNMFTEQGLKGIPGLVKYDTFYGFFKEEGKARLVSGGRYRPLTPVMFVVERAIFGQKPWIGHLVNALLYGITAMVIFALLYWIGGRTAAARHAWQFAVIGAVLYAVHPLHTEVVANIKGRDEIMSLLLSLGTLWFAIRDLPAKPRPASLVVSGVLFFLALLSKENAITFLAVVPLTLYFFSKAKAQRIVFILLPLVLAAILFLVLRGEVIGWEFGGTPKELMNNPFLKVQNNSYVEFTAGEKSATIMYTLGKYIQLLFVPHPLTHDYYPRHISIMQWTDWQVILSLLAYIALVVLAIRGLRRKKVYSYGILFFLFTLSIVSNVVFPVGTNMSERFMYMPSLGLAMAISGVICLRAKVPWKPVYAIVGLVALLFAIKTIVRNTVWKDNHTLFTTDVKTSDDSAKLLAAVAGETLTQFEANKDLQGRHEMLRQALTYVTKAVTIHPNYKLAHLIKGNAHYHLEQWEDAIAAYQNVLRIDPDYGEALKNLGVAYRDAGRYYGEKAGDLNKAIDYLSRAVQLLPEDYDAVHSLGVAYGLNNQPQKAVEMFSRGVEISPDNATAHFNLGLAYQRAGDFQMAEYHRKKAIELDPEILQKRAQN